jgi:hypothetical protein
LIASSDSDIFHDEVKRRHPALSASHPRRTLAMHTAKTAIKRYGKALQFYRAYVPSNDTCWDRRIWNELRDADAEVREYGLQGKPEYNEAILRADQIAQEIRAQRSKEID